MQEVAAQPGDPAGAGRASPAPRWPGALLAALFFAFGVLSLDDYGVTWDEPWTYRVGAQGPELFGALLRGESLRFPWQELRGYYFVFDTLRGAFAQLSAGWLELPKAYHLFHLALSALSVHGLYLLALAVGARTRVALLSALCLSLLPKFIAHSQSNPKDLPGLFAYVLVLLCVARLTFRGQGRHVLATGLALGLALTSNPLAPVCVAIAGAWLFSSHPELARRRLGSYAAALGLGAVAFLALWPWLWGDPWGRIALAIAHVASFRYDVPILYLGHLYVGTALPWHYFSVSFLTTTPLVLLLFAVLAPLRKDPAARLGAVWLAILVLVEMRSPSRYDGIRHFLMALPAFALLAGPGADWLLRLAARRSGSLRLALVAGVALGFAYLLLAALRIHPYHDAYLNEITNALIPGDAERYLEVEYWGGSYKEGARWLNEHAEPDAELIVPWTQQANFHLTRKALLVRPEADAVFADDPQRLQYFMSMTRRAMYSGAMLRLEEEYEPVFSIRRQKGTLLRIYGSTHKRAPGQPLPESQHPEAVVVGPE